MPIYKQGNMFRDSSADTILATTNSFIKKNRELVMGRGAAKELSRICPTVLTCFSNQIPHLGKYGVLVATDNLLEMEYPYRFCPGLFQVKYHWGEVAKIELINYSCSMLARFTKNNPAKLCAVNFPGIGNGQLDRKTVKPILDSLLPDNVEVWEY